MSGRFRPFGFLLVALLSVVPAGCGRDIAQFIVRTRNHQGDVALQRRNFVDAALDYRLALKLEPGDAHARSGLAAVQLQIAYQQYKLSNFDGALSALAVAAKYDPESVRLAQLKAEVQQARVKREIVLSNYPTYSETGLTLRRSYAQLRFQSNKIVTTLQHFDYTYDSSELVRAILASRELGTDVTRLTQRLGNYRQLVETGSPERSGGAPLAPAGSLLPLP